jgi:hypothetical protein
LIILIFNDFIFFFMQNHFGLSIKSSTYPPNLPMKYLQFAALALLAACAPKESDSDKKRAEQSRNLSDFLPKGYVLAEKISGDLNNDGLEDVVLLIKATDSSKVIQDEDRGTLDRNRRGLLVLLGKKDAYEPIIKNYDCFSSENEDGGVYFAPELSLTIEEGLLQVHYAHGRYGYWQYSFRYQASDLALIGYEAGENRGSVVQRIVQLDFMNKKKLVRDNLNKDQDESEEVFVDSTQDIALDKLLRLSEIKDFDALDMSGY